MVSADMKRVDQLPIIPHKTIIFGARILAYTETFALIQPSDKLLSSKRKKALSSYQLNVTWHEALRQRDAADVCSSFYVFFNRIRDFKTVVIYLDNCSRENKSWFIFGAMLEAVNSGRFMFETIILKYLEKGHTSMSADSTHQVINKNLHHYKEVQDYQDFVNKFEEISFIKVHSMSVEDFKDFQNPHSEAKF